MIMRSPPLDLLQKPAHSVGKPIQKRLPPRLPHKRFSHSSLLLAENRNCYVEICQTRSRDSLTARKASVKGRALLDANEFEKIKRRAELRQDRVLANHVKSSL
ncbi:hypothetical protein AVEN_187472-1 [Araneus ventricosus]|uniref:Uncharacterized protein n=1 Tax=Araneus ventricosus TaxID=182803 RepID=A0A4Y2BSC6_ARAVE|nr:hypothetical protein AVEN_187472-1 [Araneus ventricosus]